MTGDRAWPNPTIGSRSHDRAADRVTSSRRAGSFELCSEEEAADYLRDKCNFFKLASYRKLFSKYEGGPRDGRYVDLDFGQLRLLAALDQELRHALLGMTLDIEHFQKVTLPREMEDRGEDGYAIVADLRHRLPLQTGVPPARAQDERPQPLQLEPLREVIRRHACLGFASSPRSAPSSTTVRFCARRWGDRRPSRPPTTTSSA